MPSRSNVRVSFCFTLCDVPQVSVKNRNWSFSSMKGNPPPYTPEETKGLYPEVQGGPVPQQQYPGVYYPPQGPPAASAPPETESVTYYPTGPQQQQPQQLVINQPPVVVQTQQQRPSFVCHIILSCCVTWCCFCPCGFIAFVLASKTFQICD